MRQLREMSAEIKNALPIKKNCPETGQKLVSEPDNAKF